MTQTPTEPRIGASTPEGTVYAGISHKPARVQGSAGKGSSLTFDEMQQALKNLADHGHR